MLTIDQLIELWQQSKQEFKNGNLEEAKKIHFTLLKELPRFDNSEDWMAQITYTVANIYGLLGDIENEIKTYQEVLETAPPRIYAEAQFNLALAYEMDTQYKDLLAAKKHYQNIQYTSEAAHQYAHAQLQLGGLYLKDELKDDNLAEKAFEQVIKYGSPKHRAMARFNLYLLLEQLSYLEDIEADGEEPYYRAQYILGSEKLDLIEKKEYFAKIDCDSQVYLQKRHQINIVEKLFKIKSNIIRHHLYDIYSKVDAVLITLFIKSSYDQQVAHYTNLEVAELLLSQDDTQENFATKSPFRLSSTENVNDPEEGLVLHNILGLDKSFIKEDATFIACFTVHHNSLNQFRLYAKDKAIEEQKDEKKNINSIHTYLEEAKGASLVLNQKFFASIETTASISEVLMGDHPLIKKQVNNKALDKMPLYRCIYFDPTSGLIKIAQREEWSFHREFKNKNKENWFDKNEQAIQNWKNYQKEINQIENDVHEQLKQLSQAVSALDLEELADEEKLLLIEILLPLRYLIKHMAFREEQECRIVYMTSPQNSLIQVQGTRKYINYEPSIMECLEKIYIGPKAKDAQVAFEKWCNDGQILRKGKAPVKVKISQNPFQ